MAKVDNWYFIYDSSGYSKKDIEDLSSKLERLDYRFFQPDGLGAGPAVEQVVAWINNNQFVSTVSVGLLTNFFYDILKNLYLWVVTHKSQNKKVPVVVIFLQFQDKEVRKSAMFKFRIDKSYNKKKLEELVKRQAKYLDSLSEKDN